MTEAITPVLRNRCDYAVSVSYCVADDGAAVRTCDTGSQRITKTLGAHEMVRIEATDYNIVNNDINWIACRSYAGVVSTFSQDGTRGQCLTDTTMQATPQTRRSEAHTSEIQSLMRITYTVFCLTNITHQQHKL